MGASLVYLDKPIKDIEWDSGENDQIIFAAGAMQGWRINMEDDHMTKLDFDSDKKRSVFAVFDGHGGREVAVYTAKHLEKIIKDNEAYSSGEVCEGLRQSFLEVDKKLEKDGGMDELAELKKAQPPKKSPLLQILGDTLGKKEDQDKEGGSENNEALQLDSIGCTANLVMIQDNKKIFVANAGDSRACLGRDGKAVPLSFDHKPENDEEKARIENAGSTIQEGRVDGNLNLSRSLGDLKYKQKTELKPEEHPVTANPDTYNYDMTSEDDFIIMGCDGIWEKMSNEEMVEWIYTRINKLDKKSIKTAQLKEIIDELLNEIISPNFQETQGVGCDNMSAILIVFKK